MDDYIDAIDPERRPLFDRIHRLVTEVHPEATVRMAYQMPAYEQGGRRLSVGVWKHGVSIYGWRGDRDGGLLARHPELRTSTGTIQLSVAGAEAITDDELRGLISGALDG